MVIQHNIAALNANRQLTINNNSVSKSLEKLSSGYRINSAADDAAGLAISEKMKSQITGLDTASDNAQDGESLLETGEGALSEVHSMLNRMVELATQSANGTYGTQERSKLQDEVTNLSDEIDRISESTNFNGINLLDGSMGSGTTGVKASITSGGTNGTVNAFDMTVAGTEGLTVKLNVDAVGTTKASSATLDGSTVTINLTGYNDKTKGATGTSLDYSQDDLNEALSRALAGSKYEGAKITLSSDIKLTDELDGDGTNDVTTADYNSALDAGAININADGITTAKAVDATASATTTNTDGISTTLKATALKAGTDMNGKTLQFTNTGASEAGVTVNANGNVTVNLATGDYSASQINQMLTKAGAGMSVSYDGNITATNLASATSTALSLSNGTGLSSGGGLKLQVGDTADSYNQIEVTCTSMDSDSLGLGSVDVSTQDAAKASISLINSAIEKVSTARGNFGALENRLDHTINNISTTTENLTSAESRIRDVDMASEMMEFTKNNILTQASQAMLAQANQIPQGVLQLLK